MCNESTLNKILKEIRNAYENVYGDKLVKVVLYGSYARGDYDDESDIDIVGIVDGERKELDNQIDKIGEISSDLGLESDLLICTDVIPMKEFIKYKNAVAYYKNIEKEGIEISA